MICIFLNTRPLLYRYMNHPPTYITQNGGLFLHICNLILCWSDCSYILTSFYTDDSISDIVVLITVLLALAVSLIVVSFEFFK